jgi:hypothetical protein
MASATVAAVIMNVASVAAVAIAAAAAAAEAEVVLHCILYVHLNLVAM